MKDIEEVVDEMYDIVKSGQGKTKFSPRQLAQEANRRLGDEVDKDLCKEAVKELVASGRCVYGSYGGASYIQVAAEQ